MKGPKGIYRIQITNVEKEKNEDLFSSHRLVKRYSNSWVHVTTELQEIVYLDNIF